MSKKLNYNMSQQVRSLSLDARYIELVDTEFPHLLSLTPSGINWNWDGSEQSMSTQVTLFKEQLAKCIDLSFEIGCTICGGPRKPYRKMLLSKGVATLCFGTELRQMRREWQGVMDVLTLQGKSDAWRRPQAEGQDWKDIWTAFQSSCQIESKIIETFETDLPF